jgi:hypothetical protein
MILFCEKHNTISGNLTQVDWIFEFSSKARVPIKVVALNQ